MFALNVYCIATIQRYLCRASRRPLGSDDGTLVALRVDRLVLMMGRWLRRYSITVCTLKQPDIVSTMYVKTKTESGMRGLCAGGLSQLSGGSITVIRGV